MRPALAILTTFVVIVALAGCDDDGQTAVATISSPTADFADPHAGISFRKPAGATLGERTGPQVAVLRRGDATLVVSRFERDERLPQGTAEYRRAADALQTEYLRRSAADGVAAPKPHSSVATYADHLAVRVALIPPVSSDELYTDHLHFYEHGAEIVIDFSAPKDELLDAQNLLLRPVLNSMQIDEPEE